MSKQRANRVNFQCEFDSEKDSDVLEILSKLKTMFGYTNKQVIEFALKSNAGSKCEITVPQRVEKVLILMLGGTQRITTYSIEKQYIATYGKRVESKVVSNLISLYQTEIEAHNAKNQ